MMRCLFVVLILVLSFGTWSGSGQSTISSCKDSESSISELRESIEMIRKELNSVIKVVGEINKANCQTYYDVYDCSDIKANGSTASGVYRIHVDHQGRRYSTDAYCDMSTANRQWLIFQRRKDNTVAFDRGWRDYENGFGDPNGNFWIGNEFLYLLTSKRRYRLRIDLEDFEGQKRYAEYSTFEVSSSEDKYRLKAHGYSGDAGDSFQPHSDNQFTTKDSDNDINSGGNCAEWFRGGWWYNNCYRSNLNGVYHRGSYSTANEEGITWFDWHGIRYSLKTTEMKISPLP